MKTLKRLAVGQLNGLERIPFNELSSFLGGVNCLWECLGKLKNMYDGISDNDLDSLQDYKYEKQFKQEWAAYASEHKLKVDKNGDPDIADSKHILNFIKERFEVMDGGAGSDDEVEWIGAGGAGSTGSSATTSEWNSIMKQSADNNKKKESTRGRGGTGLVITQEGSGFHAVITTGQSWNEDGEDKWSVYDPSDNERDKITKDDIVLGVGIGQKEKTGPQVIDNN